MKAAPVIIPAATPSTAATLRRIRLLPLRARLLGCSRLLRGGALLGRLGTRGGTSRFPRDPLPRSAGADGPLCGLPRDPLPRSAGAHAPLRRGLRGNRAERALQVVEHEPYGRLGRGRRGD